MAPACDYDGGDCSDVPCTVDCRTEWLGDGVCDVDCNNGECLEEAADCTVEYAVKDGEATIEGVTYYAETVCVRDFASVFMGILGVIYL